MENIELVEKLKSKTNISYEEAKRALENSNWDILDAMLFLEGNGIIKKPSISTYYTNENKERIKEDNKNEKHEYQNARRINNFEGFFEFICNSIDTFNNIFFEVKREGKAILKLPATVLILLLIFTFGTVIPLAIIGLIFDFEYSLDSKGMDTSKVNDLFELISINIKKVKEELKKGLKK